MSGMKTNLLPDAEFEVMEAVWAADGETTTPALMESLGNKHGWKIQTLATLLKRLTERGFLSAKRGSGREIIYAPLISRAEYLATETEQFVKKVHNNSFLSLLNAMGGRLTNDELDELETFIKNAKEDKP